MDSENGFFDRYFRNVSQQRLILYGVIIVAIIVVLILVFVLILAPGESGSGTGEFVGRDVLKKVPLIDGYNILPALLMEKLQGKISEFAFDQDLNKTYTWLTTDIHRMKEGMLKMQIWTMKPSCNSEYHDAVALTLQQIDGIRRLHQKYINDMASLHDMSDFNAYRYDTSPKIGGILSIDGGHSIDSKLSVLRLYYALGVRLMSLTSECDTPWSSSYVNTTPTDLTKFGESVIKEMNRLGIVIDLRKSSLPVQKKVLQITTVPVIFSSSATYRLASNPSNVQDEILELIKKNNGLVMISFNPDDLKKTTSDEVTIEHVVEQINYVRTKIGVDYVGIGSNFDSSTTSKTKDLEDSSKYPLLFDRLAKSKDKEPKWGEEELKKLAGLNFVRVFTAVNEAKKEQNWVEENIPLTDLSSINKSCYTFLTN